MQPAGAEDIMQQFSLSSGGSPYLLWERKIIPIACPMAGVRGKFLTSLHPGTISPESSLHHSDPPAYSSFPFASFSMKPRMISGSPLHGLPLVRKNDLRGGPIHPIGA